MLWRWVVVVVLTVCGKPGLSQYGLNTGAASQALGNSGVIDNSAFAVFNNPGGTVYQEHSSILFGYKINYLPSLSLA